MNAQESRQWNKIKELFARGASVERMAHAGHMQRRTVEKLIALKRAESLPVPVDGPITDTDRIEWLSKGEKHLVTDYESGEWGIYEYIGGRSDRELVWLVEAEHPTLREAVDTAIKAERAAAAAEKKKYDH